MSMSIPQILTASERRQQQTERRRLLQSQLIQFCENGINQVINKKTEDYYTFARSDLKHEIPGLSVYLSDEITKMLHEVYKPKHYDVKYDTDSYTFIISWDQDY